MGDTIEKTEVNSDVDILRHTVIHVTSTSNVERDIFFNCTELWISTLSALYDSYLLSAN